MAEMLRLEGISKTFSPGTVQEKKALENLSLTLEAGEFVTLIGSNGAGKSTLFGAVAGSFYPDRGRVVLDRAGAEKRATSMDDILTMFNQISLETGN